MLLGSYGYKQIDALIREQLVTAERLQANLDGERPSSEAKGGLFHLPSGERVMLWRALANRLATDGSVPPEDEQEALWQEYDWAMAMQIRMPRRVAWYQLGFMLVIAALVVASLEIESLQGNVQHLATIMPYLLASFWGAVGGSAASLWELLKDVEGRTLSATGAPSHYLKPYLGAVLGLLVSLILPSNLLQISGGNVNLKGDALAALAGLSERTFITKLHALMEALLGSAVPTKSGSAPTTSRPATGPAIAVSQAAAGLLPTAGPNGDGLPAPSGDAGGPG
jgi:hypothetical protein